MKQKQIEAFSQWLEDNGCEILQLTNPYEVLRYKREPFGVVIIYKNKHDRFTIPQIAISHYQTFQLGKPMLTVKRPKKNRYIKKIEEVILRDGLVCCVCGIETSPDDRTLEHWLSISHGGTNNINNLGIAHVKCNEAVGNMSVSEKAQVARLIREHIAQMQPGEVFRIEDLQNPPNVAKRALKRPVEMVKHRISNASRPPPQPRREHV